MEEGSCCQTAAGRANTRILYGSRLHTVCVHFKEHYSFMTMAVCICTRLDAWHRKARKADKTAAAAVRNYI